MPERQGHGFSFQDYCAEHYDVVLNDTYTAKWDGVLNGTPTSIKTEKIGTDVEMADYFRNAETTEDFYLIVGFWEGTKDNLVEVHTLYVDGAEYHQHFNPMFEQKFKDLLANITNDKSNDAKWKQQITALRNEYKRETDNLVRPRFKRDHDKQKRVQCAINNGDFYSHFVSKYSIILPSH